MNINDLHPYQREAVAHILKHPSCGLFLEMGLGKTVSTLTALDKLLYDFLAVNKVLVVAPKRVAQTVWAEECEKWEHLHRLKVVKVVGTSKDRMQALRKPGDIYVIGRDSIAWLCTKFPVGTKKKWPFDMIVLDELSSFKNPKSKRFRALRSVRPMASRIVGLTGTPTPNGLIDLWSQLYLLDRGERLGRTLSEYRSLYFNPGARNGMVVFNYNLRPGAEKAITDKIGDICMSMKSEDYLQLPGRIDNVIKLKMDEDLKKQYKDFEKEKVLELTEQKEGEVITAPNAAVLANKLLQFANGAVYDADHGVHEIHDLKLEAVKELVEDANGQPVLIAWTFQSDRDRLLETLKGYHPRNLGGPQDVIDWNSGKVPVLLMHPASGGHGLNLQAGGHIIIWYGQTWSLELEQQFNARLDRQGQKEVVVVNKLVVEGTMDEDVIRAQRGKARTQDSLMEAVKARIESYRKIF